MKTCRSCGSRFDDQYLFCPYCGEKYAVGRPASMPLTNRETTDGVRVGMLYEKDNYSAYEVHLTRALETSGFTLSLNTAVGIFIQKIAPKTKGTCHKTVSYQLVTAKETKNPDKPDLRYVIFLYYVVDDWKDTLFNKSSQRELTVNETYFDDYAEKLYRTDGKLDGFDQIFSSFFGDTRGAAAGNCPDCGGTGYTERETQTLFGRMVTRQKCKSCGGTGNR